MKEFIEFFRYVALHLLPGSSFDSNNTDTRKDVYLSLTTIPSRIGTLKATINSLLDQSTKPKKIIINLAGFEKDQIPVFLLRKEIELNLVTRDLGPATKFLPTLKLVPKDALVIIVDDDQVYPKTLVQNYVEASMKFPDCALCMVGWETPQSLQHEDRVIQFGAKFRLNHKEKPVKDVVPVDIMQGASSYAIKPSFFDESLFQYKEAPSEAYYVDDIWISGHLAKRKVSKLIFPASFKYCRLSNLKVGAKTGLIKTANKNHQNNNVLYQYFKDYWINTRAAH